MALTAQNLACSIYVFTSDMMVTLGLEVIAPATPNIAFNFLLKLYVVKYIMFTGKVLHFPVAREGETHKITSESRTSRRCRRPRLAPRGKPHTGQNAICGTIHVRMVLWRRRKLKELSLLFKIHCLAVQNTELVLNIASYYNNSRGNA